jgi:molecular chaperone GrpE
MNANTGHNSGGQTPSNQPDDEIPQHEWDISDASPLDSGGGGAGGGGGSASSELQAKVTKLEQDLAEANSRALRAMADFQNYQKRSLMNESIAKASGVAGVVTGVVTVLDHFDLALQQDATKVTAEQLIGGVKVIREELLRVLQLHGVGIVNPRPGDDFVPGIHEAIMQQQAEGIAPGKVVATFQAGYTLAGGAAGGGERVLRPAKVSVAPSV